MEHPYKDFENSDLWKSLDKALVELEANQDVQITTAREYVVGYICKYLLEKEVSTKKEESDYES